MTDLFDHAKPPLDFDGETYEPPRDQVRLTGQALRVWNVMRDGEWYPISGIAKRLRAEGHNDSEAGISARLRDFRKARFGGHTVERLHLMGGLWVYRLIVRKDD